VVGAGEFYAVEHDVSDAKPTKRAQRNPDDEASAHDRTPQRSAADPELLRRAELDEQVARLKREKTDLEHCCAELAEQRGFLDQILESLPYPFYVIDAHTYEVIRSNGAATVEEGRGATTCHALTHGRSDPCGSLEHPCPLDEMRRTKAPVVLEHVHLSAEGVPFNAEIHAYPILDRRGELVRMVEYSIDVSARRRAEAEREKYVRELEIALANVRTLHGLLPICSSCKKIRDDQGYWSEVEEYILEHSDAEFSHSYCPDCAETALSQRRKRE